MQLPALFSNGRRWLLMRLIAWGFAQAIGAIATVLLVKAVFDHTLASGAAAASGGGIYIGLLAATAVAAYLARVAERTDAERLGQKYVAACRVWMYDRLSGPDARQLSPRLRGLMMARFVSDLSALRLWVSRGIARLVTGSFAAVGALIGIALINPWLALAVIAPFALVGAGLWPARHALLERIREMRRRRGRVSAHVGDVMENLRDYDEGLIGKERRRMRKRSRRLVTAATRRATVSETVRGSAKLAASLATATLLAAAAMLSTIGASDIVAILSVLGFLGQSTSDLAQALDYRLNYSIAEMKLTQSFIPRHKRTQEPVAANEAAPAEQADTAAS